jgi:GNAT superfamily N-acetyltransferase
MTTDKEGLVGSGVGPTRIERAIEVFVQGFCYTRSFTHPYLAERVGPLWVMRDAPRKRGNYRGEEWVAHGVPPAEIDQIARQQTRGRFSICVICALDEPQEAARSGFKALGYRLLRTEPLMVHSLVQIPHFEAPARVERVLSEELAARLARAARSRQILPEHFTADAKLRQYVALIDDELVGWVRSIVVGDATWCSNMYVHPDHRRRGIARALLSRMLQDDRAGGAQSAVLLASHTGAKLYPVVGYEQTGELLLFAPKER